jgi:hypothetical protein
VVAVQAVLEQQAVFLLLLVLLLPLLWVQVVQVVLPVQIMEAQGQTLYLAASHLLVVDMALVAATQAATVVLAVAVVGLMLRAEQELLVKEIMVVAD